MEFFATTGTGFGAMLAAEVEASGHPPLAVHQDGRVDIVGWTAPGTSVLRPRSAEDIFVVTGRTEPAPSLQTAVGSLLGSDQLARALSVVAGTRRLRAVETVRVVARVSREDRFERRVLRASLIAALLARRPRWREADPASTELWALQLEDGVFLGGLRLSDASMRRHGGRVEERSGALRPAAAAAMIQLAGAPGGILCDPCCGSGTILAEALDAGWAILGFDIDPRSVEVASRNLGGQSTVAVGDARRLPIADGGCAAVVTNLPFGTQFTVGEPTRQTSTPQTSGRQASQWYAAVLTEIRRVLASGSRAVVLGPTQPHIAAIGGGVGLPPGGEHPVRLRGHPAVLTIFQI